MGDVPYLVEIHNDGLIEKGTLIGRISKNKDQQGIFTGYDNDGNFIISNVIDLVQGNCIAKSGVIKISKDEKLYTNKFNFVNSPVQENFKALASTFY